MIKILALSALLVTTTVSAKKNTIEEFIFHYGVLTGTCESGILARKVILSTALAMSKSDYCSEWFEIDNAIDRMTSNEWRSKEDRMHLLKVQEKALRKLIAAKNLVSKSTKEQVRID
jgi:hypothetical protein